MTEQTIETKLKELKPYNGCRSCLHFIRVNFDSVKNVSYRQGFCILGALVGDYGLCVSRSSADCMGYIFSKEHNDIAVAERALGEDEDKFVKSGGDRRSKNYKLIEPLREETKKFIQATQQKHAGLASMMAMREVEITARNWFRENHQDDYLKVYQMVSLRKSDYNKYLAKVSVMIHDEFCGCDKIEWKPEGEPNSNHA
ncbi:MAG: hypothetical protein PHC39_04895 [Proteiniphilum sp.]|nr:hypothetical protein [Proteiniphilum sp.]